MKHLRLFFAFMICSIVSLHAQWVVQNSPVSSRLLSIHFINASTGFVSGEMGTMLKSTNGGTSWFKIPTNLPNAIDAIRFIGNDTGFAFVRGSLIYKTTNTGSTWSQDTLHDIFGFFSSACFPTHAVGYAAGQTVGGTILTSFVAKTTDAGSNWITQRFDTITSLNAISFPDERNGYAIGNENNFGGVIMKTTDGGHSWKSMVKNIYHRLTSASFLDSSIGYVCGYGGAVLKTTDGGSSWTKYSSGFDFIEAVWFTDIQTGYIVSDDYPTSVIKKTTDGGVTWNPQYERSTGFNAVVFINANTGYVVGEDGIILKTENGGTTGIKSEDSKPMEYSMMQNYPNPFNPSTTIRYALPSSAHVKLTVHDILGREVATLVNEEQSAGWKEVQWNASGFSSGIYFVKMSAETFSQTKKILLMK